jgi:hypothetical protein
MDRTLIGIVGVIGFFGSRPKTGDQTHYSTDRATPLL